MNNLRILITILISVELLIGCSASNIEVTPTLQQPTTLQEPSKPLHPTKDEAKEALIWLVKSNPNVFPDFVFKDPEDPSSIKIYFEKAGIKILGYVMVYLDERTYLITILEDYRKGIDVVFTHFWKGAFIEIDYKWMATKPIYWAEEGTIVN